MWAALASLGRDGVAELVATSCRLARRFAAGMDAAGFDVLNDVVLNQVLVSFGPTERTDAVIAAVQDEGTCWCGPTTWQGVRAMRFSVSGWSTTDDDIDRSIAAVRVLRRTRDAARWRVSVVAGDLGQAVDDPVEHDVGVGPREAAHSACNVA